MSSHALIVDGGRIVAVLPQGDADARFAPRQRLELGSHVLLPGLVNAHTHAAMTLFRGIADDVPLKVWLEGHIWPREARFVTRAFVADGVRLAAAEMLRAASPAATTCISIPTPRGGVRRARDARDAGLPVLDFPTPYAADPDGYLQADSPPAMR